MKDTGKNLDAARLQHEKIGVHRGTQTGFLRNAHPDAQWFPSAGLGLFVHFGISAVHAGVDLSWGMIAQKPWELSMGADYAIFPAEYFALAKKFQPARYEPQSWLQAAADAGFQYAVLTTRHHDGFALWPSRFGSFHTGIYSGGVDLVQPFVAACRRCGLKVGLYYSPPDWYYNREYMSFHYDTLRMDGDYTQVSGVVYGVDHTPITLRPKPSGWDAAYKQYVRGQIQELLTQYGKIDLLWFDGGSDVWDAISVEEIRALQPGIVVNTRMHGQGDFETYECRMPEQKPDGWWEHEDIWADGPWWGYMYQAADYKTAAWFVDRYRQVKAWGGNFLINVAPKADGSMPDIVYQRLDEAKALLRAGM